MAEITHTQEFKNENFVNPEFAEHSKKSGAKKVIDGPLYISSDPANAAKSINPINVSTSNVSASGTLLMGKAYRVVATAACFFRLTKGAGTAVATDVYLPANVPIVITTDRFDTISAILASGTGILQAVEVE